MRLDARLRGGRWTGRLWNAHHAVALEEIRSIGNRGPRTYRLPETLTAAEREFCYREAKLGVGGVLAALDVLCDGHPAHEGHDMTPQASTAVTGWASRAAALADELIAASKLSSPAWRAAAEAVPRHVFVPSFYVRRDGRMIAITASAPHAANGWSRSTPTPRWSPRSVRTSPVGRPCSCPPAPRRV